MESVRVLRYEVYNSDNRGKVCYFPQSNISVVRDTIGCRVLRGIEHEHERRRGSWLDRSLKEGQKLSEVVLNGARIFVIGKTETTMDGLGMLYTMNGSVEYISGLFDELFERVEINVIRRRE